MGWVVGAPVSNSTFDASIKALIANAPARLLLAVPAMAAMDKHGLRGEAEFDRAAMAGGGESHNNPYKEKYSLAKSLIKYHAKWISIMHDPIDQPITNEQEDLLHRKPFILSLTHALVKSVPVENGEQKRRATGVVLGLTGEWGSGKSSIINLLAEHLGTLSRVIVVKFNPWLFKGADDLIAAFFNELSSQTGTTLRENLQELRRKIDGYRDAIVVGGGLLTGDPTAGLASAKVINSAMPKYRPSVDATRKSLEAKISSLGVAVVVLIDELDRVEDEDVRAVARLIKAIGGISGISYLVAYDPGRVIQALGRGENHERAKSGEAYLEKIIQLPIPVRPLLHDEVENMLRETLKAHNYSALNANREQERRFITLLAKAISTPRDIKRVIGCFSALEPMVRGNVDTLDVLGYSYLLVKAPLIRDAIAFNIDAVVEDPIAESSPRGSLETIFGGLSPKHALILKWLFPAFEGSSRHTFDENKIRKRRNLLRLLYLGNPPHDITQPEIEEIWSQSASEAEKTFREMASDSRLRAFIERLPNTLSKLDPENDKVIWPAISSSFLRQHDWVKRAEPHRPAIAEISELLRAYSKLDEQRARKIAFTLLQHGDLIIMPLVFRSHLFRYGLAKGDQFPRIDIPVIFEASEVKDLISEQLSRYRRAIRDGSALKHLIDPGLFFLLMDLNEYDNTLRDSLTEQLRAREALVTFAYLMVPRGIRIEYQTADILFDFSVVHRFFHAAIFANLIEDYDPEIRLSIDRLRSFLNERQL